MPKWNPESSSRGDQGEMFVGLVVSKMGHLWHPSARREIAIDGAIELISETHQSTSRFLSVQVKTRTGAGDRRPIRLQCDPEDVAYWRQADRPVLVVLVDPGLERAWFICVQEYFSDTPTPSSAIYFDPDVDRFDSSISPYLFEIAGAWQQRPRSFVDEAASSMVTSRRVLQQFHHALTQALIDCRQESKSGPAPLFLDADVALSGALPLQAVITRSMGRLLNDDIYSTMLWRLGYLGRGTLLRPHAVEFAQVLERVSIAPRDDMVTLLRHDLTRRALAELRIAIHDPAAPVAALMEQVRRIPRESAVLVAALLLAPQSLRGISKVLGFHDDASSAIAGLMESPQFAEILDVVNRDAQFLAPRQVGAIAAHRRQALFSDSLALAMLAHRVKQYQRDEIASVGYFATQTARVISLLRDGRLGHLFRLEDSTSSCHDPAQGPESVLRTSEYLICRSTFRCLRRQASLTTLPSESSESERLTIDAVETCASELTSVIGDLATSRSDPDAWLRLERLPVSGVTLVATVEYLKSLASLDAVWLADNALGLRRLCQETRYSDVEEFVVNHYQEMIAWAQNEFADRVEAISKWRSTYNRLVARKQRFN